MKFDAAVLFIVLMLVAGAVAATAFAESDCSDKGGQLVQSAFGGLTCVGGRP